MKKLSRVCVIGAWLTVLSLVSCSAPYDPRITRESDERRDEVSVALGAQHYKVVAPATSESVIGRQDLGDINGRTVSAGQTVFLAADSTKSTGMQSLAHSYSSSINGGSQVGAGIASVFGLGRLASNSTESFEAVLEGVTITSLNLDAMPQLNASVFPSNLAPGHVVAVPVYVAELRAKRVAFETAALLQAGWRAEVDAGVAPHLRITSSAADARTTFTSAVGEDLVLFALSKTAFIELEESVNLSGARANYGVYNLWCDSSDAATVVNIQTKSEVRRPLTESRFIVDQGPGTLVLASVAREDSQVRWVVQRYAVRWERPAQEGQGKPPVPHPSPVPDYEATDPKRSSGTVGLGDAVAIRIPIKVDVHKEVQVTLHNRSKGNRATDGRDLDRIRIIADDGSEIARGSAARIEPGRSNGVTFNAKAGVSYWVVVASRLQNGQYHVADYEVFWQ